MGVGNSAVAAHVGNRALTRLLQRETDDPPKPPPTPDTKPAAVDVRELKTYQMQEAHLSDQAPDPELVKRTREYRLKKTDLSAKSFGLNVAVVKYERKGRIYYKVQANHPSKLHSETLAVKAIQKSDPTWKHTQILEVFTERHPCANCGPDLKAVRSAIKQARSARGQPITDFRVYYSVAKWEPGATRAADLHEKYLGFPPPPRNAKLNQPVKVPPKADPKPRVNPPPVRIRKKGSGSGGAGSTPTPSGTTPPPSTPPPTHQGAGADGQTPKPTNNAASSTTPSPKTGSPVTPPNYSPPTSGRWGSIGRKVSGHGLSLLLDYFFVAPLRARYDKQRLTEKWAELEPQIRAAAEDAAGETARLTAKFNGKQAIYLNVHMNRIEEYAPSVDLDTWNARTFSDLELIKVVPSVHNLSMELQGGGFEQHGVNTYFDNYFVYSIPLFDPDVQEENAERVPIDAGPRKRTPIRTSRNRTPIARGGSEGRVPVRSGGGPGT